MVPTTTAVAKMALDLYFKCAKQTGLTKKQMFREFKSARKKFEKQHPSKLRKSKEEVN